VSIQNKVPQNTLLAHVLSSQRYYHPNVCYYATNEEAGHFPAWSRPELFATEIKRWYAAHTQWERMNANAEL
jgi:hypothetical protein